MKKKISSKIGEAIAMKVIAEGEMTWAQLSYLFHIEEDKMKKMFPHNSEGGLTFGDIKGYYTFSENFCREALQIYDEIIIQKYSLDYLRENLAVIKEKSHFTSNFSRVVDINKKYFTNPVNFKEFEPLLRSRLGLLPEYLIDTYKKVYNI